MVYESGYSYDSLDIEYMGPSIYFRCPRTPRPTPRRGPRGNPSNGKRRDRIRQRQ